MTHTREQNLIPAALTFDDVRAVSPALKHYTKGAQQNYLHSIYTRDREITDES